MRGLSIHARSRPLDPARLQQIKPPLRQRPLNITRLPKISLDAQPQLGQLAQSFRYLLRAHELEPDNTQLAVKLAAIYLVAGKPVVPEFLQEQARPERIAEALTSGDADVVLVSGGSSVGAEDHAPRLLAKQDWSSKL